MSWILLLEDEPLQVKLVTDLIKAQLNLPVRSTECLDKALLLAKEGPALIISDIVLIQADSEEKVLNNDGIVFAKSIKSNPETSHLPFLLRSSLSLDEVGLSLQQTNANDYINKTASGENLIRIVKGLVNII